MQAQRPGRMPAPVLTQAQQHSAVAGKRQASHGAGVLPALLHKRCTGSIKDAHRAVTEAACHLTLLWVAGQAAQRDRGAHEPGQLGHLLQRGSHNGRLQQSLPSECLRGADMPACPALVLT